MKNTLLPLLQFNPPSQEISKYNERLGVATTTA
jgi:hypothetical protein